MRSVLNLLVGVKYVGIHVSWKCKDSGIRISDKECQVFGHFSVSVIL